MLERSFGPIKGYATPMQRLREGDEDNGAKRHQNEGRQLDAVVN